jgi:parallel beta-helix repeat protein
LDEERLKREAALGIMLTLLLINILTMVFDPEAVEASESIFISEDGSINPPTAPISTVDNITYAFTDDIYETIELGRSNIVVDGNGHELQGSGSGSGFYIENSWETGVHTNVTIQNITISNFEVGIRGRYMGKTTVRNITIKNCGVGISGGESCSNNIFFGNNITNNGVGIHLLEGSDYNVIYGNDITANSGEGIYFEICRDNTIYGNNIRNNGGDGVLFEMSGHNIVYGNNLTNNGIYFMYGPSNNFIHHNNFVAVEVGFWDPISNIWDNGYPSGGNYWSDYDGVDFFSGPYQNETGSDGIGDTPYDLHTDNVDDYPFMDLSPFPPLSHFLYTPIIPVINESVAFDASFSHDVDGTITSYYWDFGDGKNAAGFAVEHEYRDSSTYTVTLTVTDNDGRNDTSTQSVNVWKLSSSVSISASPTTIMLLESTIISGSITPIRVGAKVTIWIGKEQIWTILENATTNAEGEYSYIWTPSESGIYALKASWAGDSYTLPDETSDVDLDVNIIPEFPTWTSILLVISLSGLIIILFKRKIEQKLS